MALIEQLYEIFCICAGRGKGGGWGTRLGDCRAKVGRWWPSSSSCAEMTHVGEEGGVESLAAGFREGAART